MADESDRISEAGLDDALESTAIDMQLANFPIPPVQNPVSALPMLISRATTPHFSSTFASAAAYPDPDGLATQIRSVLADTRARGEQLPLEDWNAMSAFELSWREVNEDLLIWIYGRQDTWLSPEDVESVDCIAREVKADPEHWVVEVLREEAEMF